MPPDEDVVRLQHMAEAIQEILEFTSNTEPKAFHEERPLQHLVIRDLVILGEAASRISAAYRENHSDIPWRDMIDLRNRLVHVYFDMNLDVIWETVLQDLPELLEQINACLSEQSIE
jgi:uncharacterized protein with HEPN domain